MSKDVALVALDGSKTDPFDSGAKQRRDYDLTASPVCATGLKA